jgi:hypothetical protein
MWVVFSGEGAEKREGNYPVKTGIDEALKN